MNRDSPGSALPPDFVDGAPAHDPTLCAHYPRKEMATLSHPPPRQPLTASRGWQGSAAIVMSLVLLVAGMAAITLDSEPPLTPLADSAYLENRIVLHLTTADPARVVNMLDEVELLMKNARRHDIALQIEVIANGDGLALLRVDTSPAPQRIALLARRHAQGLRFAACQNSIERLQREENIRVQLLPAAQLVDSGIVEVVRRQREGWAYIQI